MSQKHYTLYLDESETSNDGHSQKHFCMAGVIIEDTFYASMEQVKRKIWADLPHPEQLILHQMNIIHACHGRLDKYKYPEYQRFRSKATRRLFYAGLSELFDHNKMTIVGASIDKTLLDRYYLIRDPQSAEHFRNNPDYYLVALQLLLENYCHFLCSHNGLGKIVYESRDIISDERVRGRFYIFKSMGSTYITQQAAASYLLGMDFISKQANNAGLQIADFVPNAFARAHAGFSAANNDDQLIRKLMYYRYDGLAAKNQERFGVKFVP